MKKKKDKSISAYTDIDKYISAQAVEMRPTLQTLRQTIHKAVPSAEEVISYQMPAFKRHGILMYFAVFKNHYSVFVRPVVLRTFKNELSGYTTTKSAIHIPLAKPVPIRLVTRIAKHVAKQNAERQQQKLMARR